MSIGRTNASGAVMDLLYFFSIGLDQPAYIYLDKIIPRKVFFYQSYPLNLSLSGKQICWIFIDFDSNTCHYMEIDSSINKALSTKDKAIRSCTVCDISLDKDNRELILTPKNGYSWIGDPSTTFIGYTVLFWG